LELLQEEDSLSAQALQGPPNNQQQQQQQQQETLSVEVSHGCW